MIPWLNLQLVGGGACVVIGLYLLWLNSQKLLRWPRAQGEVINVLRVGGVPTPEIEYADAQGTKYKFFAKLPYRQLLRVGAKVKILYNPQAPAEGERVSLIGAIGAPLMFAAFGFAQAFCGVAACR
jgi:hypothetical protein